MSFENPHYIYFEYNQLSIVQLVIISFREVRRKGRSKLISLCHSGDSLPSSLAVHPYVILESKYPVTLD